MRLNRIVVLATMVLLIASSVAVARGRNEPKEMVSARQDFVVQVRADATEYEKLRVVLAPFMKEDLTVPAGGIGEQLVGIVNVQVFGDRNSRRVNASFGRRDLSSIGVVLAREPRYDEEFGEIILSVNEWPTDDMVIGWGS